MEPVRRVIAPAFPPSQTPSAPSASLPGLHNVVVVLQEHHDAERAHTTRCRAQVDQVVCVHGCVQLIRTDAGLVTDLPAQAVTQFAVHDQMMMRP